MFSGLSSSSRSYSCLMSPTRPVRPHQFTFNGSQAKFAPRLAANCSPDLSFSQIKIPNSERVIVLWGEVGLDTSD